MTSTDESMKHFKARLWRTTAVAALFLGACSSTRYAARPQGSFDDMPAPRDAFPERDANSDRHANSDRDRATRRAGSPGRKVPVVANRSAEPKQGNLTPAGKCSAQTDAQCFVEQADGADKESAVRQAKASVIAQIKSKVTASSEQESVAIDQTGSKAMQRVEVHIYYTVKSEFKHGELIKFKARQDDDSDAWSAVAWLDRQSAAKVLSDDARSAKAAFDQAIADIDSAGGSRAGLQSVARAYEAAWSNFAALRQAYYEIQVLLDDSDGRKSELDALHASMAKAEHQVLRLRDSVKFDFALTTDGAFTPVAENRLRDLILSAATGLDVNTGQHSGATSGYILKINAECPCRLGSVGPICELKVGIALHKDATGEAIKLANLDAFEFGTFGQTERATVEACVTQLVEKHKKNGQRDVKDAVRKVVGAIVPLAPEVAQEN